MIAHAVGDGLGSGRQAAVNQSRALLVSATPPDLPPIGTKSRYRFFRGRAGTTGLDSGTLAHNVNGSVTNQKFYIQSQADYDIYIQMVVLLLIGSAPTHAQFGSLTALTNGYSIYTIEAGVQTYLLDSVKTNGQMFLQAGFESPYGSTTNTNVFDNWTGTTDAFTVRMPLDRYVPGGVRIGRGTNDRLECLVRDNLSTMTGFDVFFMGYKHYAVDN